jgi:hypothetical protein
MADVQNVEVDERTCISQSMIMGFHMLIDFQRTKNFNETILVKTKNKNLEVG